MDTAVSSEFEIVTAAAGTGNPASPSTDGKTWSFHTTGLSYATDVEVMSDCSDLQDSLEAAAAADGDLNHRVRVPAAANCAVNLTLPAKSGASPTGTGRLVLVTSAYADLPAEGTRIDPDTDSASMPTLYTSTTSPVVLIDPSAHYWVLRGLKIMADPALYSVGGDVTLVTSFT